MKTVLCCFASHRYLTDSELHRAFTEIKDRTSELWDEAYLVDESFDPSRLACHADDLMIALPMSGGVQPSILSAAEYFREITVYAGYVKGSFSFELTQKMLTANAAPAVMDVYAVLKRKHTHTSLAVNYRELEARVKATRAVSELRSARLLAIGETEPWVISATRDGELIRERLGIELVRARTEELRALYDVITPEEAKCCADAWRLSACEIIEPTDEDILNAARLEAAILRLLEKYDADGAAIACFDLLSLGTTSCLGVSYVNTHTDLVISCEGDLDSAITMLLMKRLARDSVWMANPNIQPDGTVNFVHCTAPTAASGKPCKYSLRSHHESGIGVSTEVELPENIKMTACRISDGLSKMMVESCTGVRGEYEPSCRTQLKITLESFEGYLKNALGCHTVFAFCDIKRELIYAAELLGIEVLS